MTRLGISGKSEQVSAGEGLAQIRGWVGVRGGGASVCRRRISPDKGVGGGQAGF